MQYTKMAMKGILLLLFVFCVYRCHAECPNVVTAPANVSIKILGYDNEILRVSNAFHASKDHTYFTLTMPVRPYRVLESLRLSGTFAYYRVFHVSGEEIDNLDNSTNYLNNATGDTKFYPSSTDNHFDEYIGGQNDYIVINAYAPDPREDYTVRYDEIRICVQPLVGISVTRDVYKCNPDADITLNVSCLAKASDTSDAATSPFNVDTEETATVVVEYKGVTPPDTRGINRYRYSLSHIISGPTLNVTCDLKNPPTSVPDRITATVTVHDLFATKPQITVNGTDKTNGFLYVMAGSDVTIHCDAVGGYRPSAVTGIKCTGFDVVASLGNHAEFVLKEVTTDDQNGSFCYCIHQNVCHRTYSQVLILVRDRTRTVSFKARK